jgi:hypothetical protein
VIFRPLGRPAAQSAAQAAKAGAYRLENASTNASYGQKNILLS